MMTMMEHALASIDDVQLRGQLAKRCLDRGQLPEALNAVDMANWYAHCARNHVVELLRESGATWQAIGDMLDISPQAAQQRFGAKV